ncbi:hypothetical protein EST38_g226 [Candolleomyces aberdarensis]|uniref:Uncharacterized protein n=1 Tax=Candolleomyces aberdarensis TaxID=2316362 RepID=A0A4Q2E1N5_9AGAR|nr:hypothetical protein EST38_g226 [Candolleomyces aberdarensis]
MSRSNGYHEHVSRTAHNQQPRLDTLSEELGLNQTVSPRSELLSTTTTEERRRRHASGTHESRRRKHRRSSHKHGSHDTGSSDTSQRELVRIVLEQEAEADNLKQALQTTLQQLDEQSQKVAEYERGTREAAERFKQLNDSRLAAEQNASTANQQLHLYQFQLSNAQKEILTAQDTVKALERQKDEAEDMAARARARARKLHQKQLVLSAKEEGRRAGFEAGVKQAQEELFITTTARRAMAQAQGGSRRRHGSPRTLVAPSPPIPQSPVEDATAREDRAHAPHDDSGPVNELDSTTAYSEIETLKSPLKPRARYLPPSENENNNPSTSHDPRMGASTSQPQPSTSQRPDRAYTPSIRPYRLDIPIPEQLPENSKWVTAQQYREINGSQTSHTNSLRTMPRPIQEPVPEVHAPPQQVNPQTLPRPMSTVPPPQPVFPVPLTAPFAHGQTPPKRSGSGGGSARKLLRFPTMAKNKAQSWYRSFSLRKKNRPVIDPIDEEEHEQLVQQQNGQGHGNETGSETNDLYRTQLEPPKSWYQVPRPVSEVKSQKAPGNIPIPMGLGHSRAASMEDGRPGERVSRASTRLSHMDMIMTAPRGYQGEAASVSNQSNAKKLAQKLSVITEDPQSRGVTPLTEQPYGTSMRGPIPSFALSPQSDTSRSRKRPPQIGIPNPPGFDPNDPFVQGNYHLFPNGVPNGMPHQPPPMPSVPTATPSSKRSEDIGINIQPAVSSP